MKQKQINIDRKSKWLLTNCFIAKIFMRISWLILIGSTVTVLLYFTSEDFQIWVAEVNTVYPSKFTYEQFKKVKLGMSTSEIHAQLGEAYHTTHPGLNCFIYSQSRREGHLWFPMVIGWISTRVCFNYAGHVVGIYRNVFAP